MERISATAAFVMVAMAAGCGGSSVTAGSGSATGQVGGQSLAVADAISFASLPLGDATAGGLVLTSYSGACGIAHQSSYLKNAKAIAFDLLDFDGTHSTAPTAPGSYAVVQLSSAPTAAGKYAVGGFASNDAACTQATVEFKSGTLVLSRISNGFAGTFDVMTTNNEHLTGTFDAASCSAPSASDAGHACQ